MKRARGRSSAKQGVEPVGYARRLQKGHDKGRCGAAEIESSLDEIEAQAKRLAQLLRDAPIVVAHTGAGLSTAAGIPDFRGQRGVWTMEEQGEPLPKYERCWDNAVPTLAHMALVGLVNAGLLHGIISQNVDGLHLRSGIPREKLCELHGNLFMELCPGCEREVRRTADVGGVGFRQTGRRCNFCGEALVDVLLDWEDELRDYDQAVDLSKRCGVDGGIALCLGTSLQISPSKDLPAQASKMVIVNLQTTAKDKRAELSIRGKTDTVMRCVLQELKIPIPIYRRTETLVISHTCARGKGSRWKWNITVGDTADGARCGYIESMTVSFPGTRLTGARIISAPFRVSRTTKSFSNPVESFSAGTVGEESVAKSVTAESVAEDARETVLQNLVAAGVSDASSEQIHSQSGGRNAAEGSEASGGNTESDGHTESGGRRNGFVTESILAVLELEFVAAPGHTAREGQTVEYVLDLSRSEGSLAVMIFLGEFDYNNDGLGRT